MNSPSTLYEMICSQRDDRGSDPAYITPDSVPFSYNDLAEQASYTKQQLLRVGIKKGTPVGIVASDAYMATALLSVASSSAIAVPINPNATQEELERQLKAFDIKAVMVSDRLRKAIDLMETISRFDIPVMAMNSNSEPSIGKFTLSPPNRSIVTEGDPLTPPSSDDIAVMLPTSGTTAAPKVIPITHGACIDEGMFLSKSVQLSSKDRMLSYLFLHHPFGMSSSIITPLVCGGGVVFGGDFKAGRHVADMAKQHRATAIFAASPFFRAMSRRAAEGRYSSGDLSTVRKAIVSGSPATSEVLQQMQMALPQATLYSDYGTTETLGMVCSSPSVEQLDQHIISKSRDGFIAPWPLPVDAKILDPNTETQTREGHVGELVVKTPQMEKGYLNHLEASAFTSDGFYRTGDTVSVRNGILYLCGRCNDLIKVNAQKVSPAEVEGALQQVSGIEQAVVFGVRSLRKGSVVAAAVEVSHNLLANLAKDSSARDQFLSQLRLGCEQLSAYKRPTCYVVTDEIPTIGALQKISRPKMANMLDINENSQGIIVRTSQIAAPDHAVDPNVASVSEVSTKSP